jgi:CubicO group peptidase (beta-lactamase class C family)
MKRFRAAFVIVVAFLAAAARADWKPAAIVDDLVSKTGSAGEPGCSVAVVQDGAIVYERSLGLANVELRVPINNHTVFLAGSIAKQFTALAVFLLAREGRLDIDADVRRYLPELPVYARPVTIRQLLGHTSGLKDDMELLKAAGLHTWDDHITEADVFSIVARQRTANFAPGSEFLYSDTGYDLLAIIVRRVSGKSLRAFAAERIFKPLGMTETLFRDDASEPVPGRASGYVREHDALHIAIPDSSQVGAANLFTTAHDLAIWAASFEHPAILGAAMDDLQREGHLADGMPTGYAGGLELRTYRGHRVIQHDGAQAGYVGDLMMFPDDHLAIAQLCNVRRNAHQLPRQIAGAVLGLDTQPATAAAGSAQVTVSPAELARVAGTYWNDRDGSYNVVTVAAGKVMVTDSDHDTYELVPVKPNVFGVKGEPPDIFLAFSPAGDASPRRLERHIGSAVTSFVRMQSGSHDHAVSRDIAGLYVSDEVGASWTFLMQNGHLVLRRPRFDDEPLTQLFADGYESGQWFLHFVRDRHHRVIAVDALNARLRKVRFARR